MTVDANRSESLLCMDKAREAIKLGDADKAKRFLMKAKKLDPSQNIDFLTKKIDAMTSSSQSSSGRESEERSYAHDDHYEESNLKRRNRSPTKNVPKSEEKPKPKQRSASRTPKLGVDYTKEQLDLVERIRNCKDYYEILKVSKSASDDDIRKEYRKMALKLHPDKCRAPHATEAFKALGNAYAVLSDGDKRRQYDQYGAEQPTSGVSRRSHGHHRGSFFQHEYSHGFEAEFTPEEIFNMFFGGGFPSDSVHRRQQPRHQHHTHQTADERNVENIRGLFFQLLPLIAIVVLGMLAQIMVSDPAYSMNQTHKYAVRRTTNELKVPYFVRPDFEQTYKNRIRWVEQQVEDDYIQNLRMNCFKEQNLKETKLYRARWTRDSALLKEAERMVLPSCVRLNEIYSH